jgi:hypothetical protein
MAAKTTFPQSQLESIQANDEMTEATCDFSQWFLSVVTNTLKQA